MTQDKAVALGCVSFPVLEENAMGILLWACGIFVGFFILPSREREREYV
jgi:hypothetical protein